MYPAEITEPCRKELTDAGVTELKTAAEVEDLLGAKGTALIVINSVCGCAAGAARPAVRMALQHEKLPATLATVFAGVDQEATAAARSHMVGYAPSSPSIALFKDGQAVFVMERHMIEGRGPDQIAFDLVEAFDTYCG